MCLAQVHNIDASGALTHGPSVMSQALWKDVTIVDVKSTESDAHFIGYFTGFSIEMLWYLVLTYWVGIDNIAIMLFYEKLTNHSNAIWATMWENDSLRKKFHYHRNRIVCFYRVMLLIFKFLFDWIIQILKWDMAYLLKAYVIATKNVAKVVYVNTAQKTFHLLEIV